MSQRTLEIKPVSAGLAKQLGRMVEDAMPDYPGGLANAELVKGDPDFAKFFYEFCDVRAAERAKIVAIQDRPVWRQVKIGTHKSNAELRSALVNGKFQISSWGGDILNKTDVATEPTELPLVLVSGEDLGLKGTPTRKQIFDAALATGILDLCPAEVGPQLRLQYTDQPKGEWNPVAMEPITDSDGDLELFYLEHDDGGLWLDADDGYPDIQWCASNRWVFVRK